MRGPRQTPWHEHAERNTESEREGLGHVHVGEVVDREDQRTAVAEGSEVLGVQTVDPRPRRGPAEGEGQAREAAALRDTNDAGPALERAIERVRGVSGEERDVVLATVIEER